MIPQPLTDIWDPVPSNDFSVALLCQRDWSGAYPQHPDSLCGRCSSLDIWENGFSMQDNVEILSRKATECGLCRMLYQSASDFGKLHARKVHFSRVGSAFYLRRNGPAVLSICTDKDVKYLPPYAQVGFPKLPEPGSPAQFSIIGEWLLTCDNKHSCNSTLSGHLSTLPTRVLDVGTLNNPGLSLRSNVKAEKGKYVALSHRWGEPPSHPRFCTTRNNLHEYQRSISSTQLPQTFQDAVTVTRNIGVRYLWIDSLCIIQDDPEDWELQSGRMEDVFSDAYCTIAASCAEGTTHGFLRQRPARDFVTIKQPNSTDIFYVCKAIDNFRCDVEEGQLNRRGWVLQERALSRRTVHFTETQMYWECGDGVHCETLTKMRNSKAELLGDAEFPKSAERFVKGGKIQLFEFVYKLYSNLDFTRITDRPVAIGGLEKRLIRTFDTAGGYGVFHAFLERSLLWQRGGEEMVRIDYPPYRKVPSWSWMAYEGHITYVTSPLVKVDWHNAIKLHEDPHGGCSYMALEAAATDLRLDPSVQGAGCLVFDEPQKARLDDCKFVVAGRDRFAEVKKSRRYYLLIIQKISSDSLDPVFERVGAGFVEEKYVEFIGEDRAVRIW